MTCRSLMSRREGRMVGKGGREGGDVEEPLVKGGGKGRGMGKGGGEADIERGEGKVDIQVEGQVVEGKRSEGGA